MDTKTLTKTILFAIVRAVIVGFGAILIKNGWVTAEQAGNLTSPEMLEAIVGILTVAGTITYSVLRTKVFHQAIVSTAQGDPVPVSKITSLPQTAVADAKGDSGVTGGNFVSVLFATFVAAALVSCATSSHFDQNTYNSAQSLKSESLSLMSKAPGAPPIDQIESLQAKLSAQLAYEQGKGKENLISAKQWEILVSPDYNLLGRFLADWKNDRKFSRNYVTGKTEQVSEAYDQIIRLEGAKPTN